jgi:hypothetical protein
MAFADSIAERRCELRASSGVRFVQRDEFCRPLTGLRRFIRADDPGGSVRGLLDVETGERHLIEREKLFVRS